jgi:hypothetical protein
VESYSTLTVNGSTKVIELLFSMYTEPATPVGTASLPRQALVVRIAKFMESPTDLMTGCVAVGQVTFI